MMGSPSRVDVTVRRGTLADLDAVTARFHALWPEVASEQHRGEAAAVLSGRPASAMPLVVFVAETGGQIVGFVEASLRSTVDGCDPGHASGYVEGWFVDAAHRGRGVGRALIDAAEAWARVLGCTEMGSDALATNAISEKAHVALGYEIVDRCVNFRKTIAPSRRAAGGGRLRLHIATSLDGYVAGPRQSVEHPLGVGGMRLHDWVFGLEAWRSKHGLEGGLVNLSTAVVREVQAGVGAVIMGRNMFGGHPGPWDEANPWSGWWGEEPPHHAPVFVLTHHARATLPMKGGTTFAFVTDGIATALEMAREAARGEDVSLAGGASVARQFLAMGLVDEMWIHLVPTLLGGGERLFEGTGDDLHGLALVRTVAAPDVTHLKYVRGQTAAR